MPPGEPVAAANAVAAAKRERVIRFQAAPSGGLHPPAISFSRYHRCTGPLQPWRDPVPFVIAFCFKAQKIVEPADPGLTKQPNIFPLSVPGHGDFYANRRKRFRTPGKIWLRWKAPYHILSSFLPGSSSRIRCKTCHDCAFRIFRKASRQPDRRTAVPCRTRNRTCRPYF